MQKNYNLSKWNEFSHETNCTFDEEVYKQMFAVQHIDEIEMYKKLPQEILEKIADIRVFALGYVSAEVKRLLRPYCNQLRHSLRIAKEKAYAQTAKAKSHLTIPINLSTYDFSFNDLEEKNGSVYIRDTYDNNGIMIKNAEIIEGKNISWHSFDYNAPNSLWNFIIACELYYVQNMFVMYLLISECDERDHEELRYVTIRGTDIVRL